MDQSAVPTKFPIPWANGASVPTYSRPIPTPSQQGITPGAASLTDGFPPATFLPLEGGGIPPFGQDANGILNQITSWIQYNGCAGIAPQFDGTFSTSIGGYGFGAILSAAQSTTVGSPQGGNHLWVSLADNNNINPDTTFNSANWIPVPAIISTSVTYTVGGTGSQFSDLHAALSYLSRFTITDTGFVTLQYVAGIGPSNAFSYTSAVVFDHPNNGRIAVIGAAMAGSLPTSDTGYATNGSSSGTRTADLATNLAMLRTKFTTELNFVGCNGFIVQGGAVPVFDQLLLTGDGVTGGVTGIYINSTNQQETLSPTTGIAVCSFGGFGIGVEAGFWSVSAQVITLGHGVHGLRMLSGGHLEAVSGVSTTFVTMQNTNDGISLEIGGTMDINFSTHTLYSECNGSDGLSSYLNSAASIIGGTAHFWKNGGNGVNANNFASIRLNSNVDLGAGTGNANTSQSAVASNMGFVSLNSAAHQGTTSPAQGNVGNQNAFITSN